MKKYVISFFTVRFHSDMRAFIDGTEIGKMPTSCEVSEGYHHIMIKHLTNFRWKEIHFDINLQKHTNVTAKYNPLWGSVKIYVDDEKVK